MKKLFIVVIILVSLSTTLAVAQLNDGASIREVLNSQLVAWNSGNVDNFMKGYWNNDSLMFIGKSGITYGWQKTLDNYKRGYPDTTAMGKLTFNLLEFKPLSSIYYFVAGKWLLQRSIGNLKGYFTLLFKKINGQWFIVADHTS